MFEEENEAEYKRKVLGAFNATEVEPMQIIHSGKDDRSFLLRLAFWTKESFKAIFARPKEETAGARERRRELAFKEAGERALERYDRRTGRRIFNDPNHRAITTSDMDINAILAEPNRVGEKKEFAHTGQLDADRKAIKKQEKRQEKKHIAEFKARKKRAKKADKILRKKRVKDSLSERETLEAEIAELEKELQE